jgi:hypothetical protein
MDADMPLERKLDILMDMAGDDHDGAGGRREGAAAAAAAREGRRRAAAAEHPAAAHVGRQGVADAHPDDQRLQLQLPLLPHAARPLHAAHAAQARGARPHLPGGAPPRVVQRAVPHHRHPRPPGEGDGRPDHRAGAAAREAPLRRLRAREDGPRRRGRADRAADGAGQPRVAEPGGALRRAPGAHRPGEEPGDGDGRAGPARSRWCSAPRRRRWARPADPRAPAARRG